MQERPEQASIEDLGSAGADLGDMARAVKAGLTSVPKDLSPWPKYFYDAEGSEIFEEITAQPEYYQTRTELSILQDRAGDLVSRTGCRELVELGSGSASKTRALLDAMFEAARREDPPGSVRYVPMDVSASAVEESAGRLLEEYPGLDIQGFVGDFDHSVGSFLSGSAGSNGSPEALARRLVIFLGGTIGNFTPEKRQEFLREVQSGLSPGDYFMVGMDLVKDRETLKAAYNDAAGVTARFNKNLLKVVNEKLGGEFDPQTFSHDAVFNEEDSRIEMWLTSELDQEVPVAGLGLEVPFEAGEGIRTEISTKFTYDSARRMFDGSGLSLVELYTDRRDLFGLALGSRGG